MNFLFSYINPMKKLALAMYVFLFLTGCAAHSGVVQIGPDTFMVSRQADKDYSGLGVLRGEALEEAYLHCIAQNNRFMRVVNITDFLPPDISRGFSKTEVTFMCLEGIDERFSPRSFENLSANKTIVIK